MLGYPVRKASAQELLYGGVRLQRLVQRPFPLKRLVSEHLKIKHNHAERLEAQIEYDQIHQRMMPLNVGHRHRYSMGLLRNQDCHKRWEKRNSVKFHTPSSQLSIAPDTTADAAKNPAVSNLFQTHRYMPFQIIKPMQHSWSVAGRSSGVRQPHANLFQERIDQKGFGHKRKARSLWQQDTETRGHRPHRFY